MQLNTMNNKMPFPGVKAILAIAYKDIDTVCMPVPFFFSSTIFHLSAFYNCPFHEIFISLQWSQCIKVGTLMQLPWIYIESEI